MRTERTSSKGIPQVTLTGLAAKSFGTNVIKVVTDGGNTKWVRHVIIDRQAALTHFQSLRRAGFSRHESYAHSMYCDKLWAKNYGVLTWSEYRHNPRRVHVTDRHIVMRIAGGLWDGNEDLRINARPNRYDWKRCEDRYPSQVDSAEMRHPV